jgi:hypothetical protein
MAGAHNIVCDQGSTFALSILWTDSNQRPISLAGYTARMHVRPSVESATLTIALTTENGGIVLDAETGRIELRLTATQAAALVAGAYVYDLELVNGATVTRIIEGAFTVRAEVTR